MQPNGEMFDLDDEWTHEEYDEAEARANREIADHENAIAELEEVA